MNRVRFSLRVKEEMLARFNGNCGICGEPLSGRIDWDHILPLALGGLDEPSNIQPVHADGCHKTKTADDVKRIRKADRMGGKRGSQYARRKRNGPQLKSNSKLATRPFQKKEK
jgi:5-methylcytosine-specific restriction enzyme A